VEEENKKICAKMILAEKENHAARAKAKFSTMIS